MAERSSGTSPWEWAAASVSTLLVLALAGYMIHQGVTNRGGAPEITVQVDSVSPVAGRYRVEFRARNRGDATAAGLHVEGELRADTGQVETSEVTIDYVPAGARRKAVLWFTHDPRRHHLTIRPTGHDLP